jgi:NitT/TauT family transport system substrate-binding protein
MNSANRCCLVLSVVTVLCLPRLAIGETKEVRLATGYGLIFLPMMLMQHDKLIEKHAKALGLGEVNVIEAKLAGGPMRNDALLAGAVDFVGAGVTPLIIMWSKTQGGANEVKAIGAMESAPILLNTRNQNIHSLKDFTENDKIALPGVKASLQAVVLQMAAAKELGFDNYARLDRLTVSLAPPDGMAALMSTKSEINSTFSIVPYEFLEIEIPGVRNILNSYEVVGGPHTNNVIYTTAKFYQENPKTYLAVVRALEEAIKIINSDKRAASIRYLELTKEKFSVNKILEFMSYPGFEFKLAPERTMDFADFLFKTGVIKVKPNNWKDMFFPNAHGLPGS